MILVTGGTGLVGAHLLFKLLQEGVKVRALKRENSNTAQTLKVLGYYTSNAEALFNNIEWLEVDLRDTFALEEAFNGITEVYHCAALVSYLPQDAQKMIKENTAITANLVNASLHKGVSKFCMVSSVAAIGKEKNEPFVKEEHIWKNDPNNSAYSISKYNSEMEVWRGHEEGLNVVIVNPSIVLGPGNWRQSSSTLFRSAYKGMPFYTNGTTGFVDVNDVVNCMVQLMEKSAFGQRFILNSENIPFKQFFDEAAKGLGKKAPTISTAPWMSALIWRVEWLRNKLFKTKPIITKDTAHSAHSTTQYSAQKIKETLGYNFKPLRESIAQTTTFYLKDLKV